MRFGYVVSLLGLGLVACSDDVSKPGGEPGVRVTWYQDVAPLLARRCMSCHQEGGIGPFPLTGYEVARDHSQQMLSAVARGAMPPFDAREEPDCTPRFGWVDDPRLSATEKATLQAWVEDGHPLGTVAEVSRPPLAQLQGVSKTLVPAEGWAPSGPRDQFICYVLDPGNAQQAWLTGLQLNPDIDATVHHAVISALGPGQKQDELIAQRGIGKPFDCSVGGVPHDYMIHVWTPGNQPMMTPDELAVPLAGGAKLVMQVHYHAGGRTYPPDKTSIDLRFSEKWPTRMYFVGSFGNAAVAPDLQPGPHDRNATPEFFIPRDVDKHTERMRIPVPDLFGYSDVRVYSANPHMHLLGTHLSARIERPSARGPDPRTECLSNGGWNFDWQRTYTYDAPLDQLPSIAQGDVIEVTCTWDNSMGNPFMYRMLEDSGLARPIDVTLGEETMNEMCLAILGLSVPAPPQPRIGEAPPIISPKVLHTPRLKR